MSLKKRLYKSLFCAILALASFGGAPLRADQVDDLMRAMNRTRLVRVAPDDAKKGGRL